MTDGGWVTDPDGTVRCEACGIPQSEDPLHNKPFLCYAPWEHGEAGV